MKFYKLILLVVLLFVASSCKKEDVFGYKFLNYELCLDNPLFESMLDEINQYDTYVNNDGIMVFDNREALKNTIEILETYCDSIIASDTSLSYSDVLNAFGCAYHFQSLYTKIENQIEYLEQNELLSDQNDPDNHFVGNIFLRAILTPDCEVIVGDTWFIIQDGFTLGIMNHDVDTRDELLNLINSNSNSTKENFFFYCNTNKNAFISSNGETVLNPEFTCQVSASNPLSYSFINMTSCEEYADVNYLWNFGDGNTSTLSNPSHTYSVAGSYTVRLIVSFNNYSEVIEKNLSVGFSTSGSFTYFQDEDGVYYFSALPFDTNLNIVECVWDFGDGTEVISYDGNCTHRFDEESDTYNVSLTVVQSLLGGYSCEKCLNNRAKPGCMSVAIAHSGTQNYPHAHIEGDKYAKTYISVYSGWILQNIMSRTIYLQRRQNGTYRRIKAEKIGTYMSGDVYMRYDNEQALCNCGYEQVINLSKYKEKQIEVTKSYNFNHYRYFTVAYRSMCAMYSINGSSFEEGVRVHNQQN